MSAELLRLRCRGHRDIRATHAKTLEFTTDSEITGRATCVVGVGGVVLGGAVVGAAPGGIAGPVSVTISAGGHGVTVRALANSRWRPGGSAVIRRSGRRLPNTLATDADLGSSDLPRALVAAMADPDAVIEVVITRDVDEGRVIRYRASELDERLAAECAAADAVVAEDAGARKLVTTRGVPDRGRVLFVSTQDVQPPALLGAGHPVEVIGLPPELAVACASPLAAPTLIAVGRPRREVSRLLAAHRHARVVFTCPAEELPRRLDEAAGLIGTTHAAVLADDERPVWGPVTTPAAGSGDVYCAVDPVESEVDIPAVDVAALLKTLLAGEVSATTVVKALAAQPGWSRKQAYDLVLGLTGKG
ncbi:DUF371 domain-containing protein [Actinokineospora enzanensis]|uniref:DUF371 domain-containing protein n=1 Tax=Actinokineospora enzanensis TaxID=155975 RepID=UPI00036A60FD|nr:DUF371 domain-containing protein [Actinokineospora enzanensis]